MHRTQDASWPDAAREMFVDVAAVLWAERKMAAALSGATLMLGLIAAFMGPPDRVVTVASATGLIAFGVGLMAVVSRLTSLAASNAADGASAHAIRANSATRWRAEGKPVLTVVE